MSTSTTTLRQLANLISNAVDEIEAMYAEQGLQFPSLDSPFDPTQASNTLLSHPKIVPHASIIVAATEQLSVAVRPPQLVIMETSMAFHKSSCLGAASAGGVVEILREAGEKGVHVRDIAAKNGADPAKLSRILRLLATHNIFRELEPDVFTNNRVSSALDTKKPSSELFTDHDGTKYDGPNSLVALVEHIVFDILRSSAYMTENLFDPQTRLSNESTETAFNRAWNTQKNYFDWMYTEPSNKQRATRLGYAMKAVEADTSVLREGDFPWGDLPAGSKIVDVGGGIGTVSVSIAKQFPELRFVIQDFPNVVEQARSFCEQNLPGCLESGRIALQGHDFFKAQPVKDADLWVLRVVIHNWPTSSAIKILQQLRDASVVGKTKLLLVDTIVDYPCESKPASAREITGADRQSAPKPLLSNYGRASCFTNLLDIHMMVQVHGQERTIADHVEITEKSGWKITRVYTPVGSRYRQILAEAV